MAKKYDPITKAIKDHVGDILFRVLPELIKEVFKLNPNRAVHGKLIWKNLKLGMMHKGYT